MLNGGSMYKILIIFILIFINSGFSATSIMGPTGVINVPSPKIVDKGFFEGGIHYWRYSFDTYKGSGGLISYKANFGLSDNVEVGFEKSINTDAYLEDPGITVNLKASFNIGENLGFAGGFIFDSDSNDYSSAYFVVGAPMAFFGFGFNFGGHENVFNHAAFGGYDFSSNRPDEVFFLAGAEFKINFASFLIGYNGDYISLGLRAPIENQQATIDVAWMSDSDYEDYYRYIFNPKYSRKKLLIGISSMF